MSTTARLGQPRAPFLLGFFSLSRAVRVLGPEVFAFTERHQRLMGLPANGRLVIGEEVDQLAFDVQAFAPGDAGGRGAHFGAVILELVLQLFGTQTGELACEQLPGEFLDFSVVRAGSRAKSSKDRF